MFLAQRSDFLEFLSRIDSDFIGVVMILGTVFTFVTVIVTIVTISRTVQDIVLVRSNRRMVEDLLTKGYTVDDVERLVYGQNRWSMLTRMLQRCRRTNSGSVSQIHQPRPPVKMPA